MFYEYEYFDSVSVLIPVGLTASIQLVESLVKKLCPPKITLVLQKGAKKPYKNGLKAFQKWMTTGTRCIAKQSLSG